ncbi:uncharacterized protein [Rutidosis leptorrhynchoides]|uniref:uncharacterized protein n=1 Tax=Rutidosis leptorrhynchoides TaxID=125765 RepID=UPI003A9A61C7
MERPATVAEQPAAATDPPVTVATCKEGEHAGAVDRSGSTAVQSDAAQSFCWEWTRPPTGRTYDELVQISSLIGSLSFDPNAADSWKWNLSSNGRFTVKKLSTIIDDTLLNIDIHRDETIRNSLIPKKIELFAWRALQKRLPVRMELDKRGIDLHSVRCPLCDDDLETVDHVLIFCKHAQEVWTRVYNWWNRGSFSHFSINELLRGDINIWQAVTWSTSYFIWRNRNNKVFHDKSWNAPVALNEIQVCSFDWISRRIKGSTIDWNVWITNPVSYLS